MTKIILSALTVMFALSAPAFASGVIYQEEPSSSSGEGEQSKPDKD